MKPLNTAVETASVSDRVIGKIVSLGDFLRSNLRPEECIYWADHPESGLDRQVLELPWNAVYFSDAEPIPGVKQVIYGPKQKEVIGVGDVVTVSPATKRLRVLFRRESKANFIFVTNRCNSNCLMCSQPPTPKDDSWLIEEALRTIPLIDTDQPWMGLTGGEPTLAGDGLISIIRQFKEYHATTGLHILTNGRLFGRSDLAARVRATGHERVVWAVPLYSDVAETHDYVVQSEGAFEETVAGLYRLAEHKQQIEIRIVLHALTIPRIREFSRFIYRNFSFVSHVALMGIEPTGFAKSNRERLWIDPADYMTPLEDAIYFLHNRDLNASIYNLPLCVLKPSLISFARQSISDWKNMFVEECERCTVRNKCSGFFASHGEKWKSRAIKPIELSQGGRNEREF